MTQIDSQASSSDTVSQTSKTNNTQSQDHTPSTQTLYPQFILFGDSITQQASTSVQPTLQTLYIRRLDILNRGFSGYTTTLACEALSRFIPITTPSPTTTSCIPPIKILLIFFGGNDACLPGSPQHIPLAQFTTNLLTIINYPVFTRHSTKIILVTTPPINEHQGIPQRTAKSASIYASAVRDIATSLHLPCLDIWRAFMDIAGYNPSQPDHLAGSIDLPPNPELASLLTDGLHFTPRGYEVFSNELMKVIKNEIPECLPENLPIIFQEWREALNLPPV